MDSPFIFVKEVIGDGFIGRKDELAWLTSNMLNAQNSVIIAPPRYGKTSLIRQSAIQVQKQDLSLKICHANIFNVYEEYEFYALLANKLIATVANTLDDWKQLSDQYLQLNKPEIIIDNKQNEVRLLFDENKLILYKDEVIELPQRIATDRNIKMVMCIEEFHNIENFEKSQNFQKYLVAKWKTHNQVCYVLSGGKKNLMCELFEKPKTPLNHFGDILKLEPIDEKLMVDYITKAFSKSGRVIQKELAEKLCKTVRNQPYYVQQFAHLVWINTKGFVTEAVIENSVNDLLDHNRHLFEKQIDWLSNSQINYLKAVIDGVDRFCSADTISNYKLNSSANVTRVRGALEKKEVLEFIRNKPHFIDPVLEIWFRQDYMRNTGIIR